MIQGKKEIKKLVSTLFKDDYGRPFKPAKTQLDIITIIALRLPVNRKRKRHIVMTPTQYGKSEAVSIGVLLNSCLDDRKWGIIGPTKEKGRIIQSYVIKHIFDNSLFISQLRVDIPLERLKMERSKDRITFKGGGESRVFTAEAKNKNKVKGALMGFGAPNLVIDESALLADDIYTTAKRMVGGHPDDNFLLEIGNPFLLNHFKKTWEKAKNYNKIRIDWRQAVKEGRLDPEFVEEMRDLPLFDILYEVQFPPEDAMDEQGYYQLLTSDDIYNAKVDQWEIKGKKKLGVDVGRGGGGKNAFIIRTDDYAWVERTDDVKDLMVTANNVIEIAEHHDIKAYDVFVDDTGVGGGVTDALKAAGWCVNDINMGEKAGNGERFANSRAEGYWGLKNWIEGGGRLKKHDQWDYLTDIKWKQLIGSRKIIIEPKEEFKKRNGFSPDVLDALALTFCKQKAREPDIYFL